MTKRERIEALEAEVAELRQRVHTLEAYVATRVVHHHHHPQPTLQPLPQWPPTLQPFSPTICQSATPRHLRDALTYDYPSPVN